MLAERARDVASWHLGPVAGCPFWWVLVTSPEVLVFLFFMITDPKTSPRAQRDRVIYAVAGVLAALLIAPTEDRVGNEGRAARLRWTLVCAAHVPVLALFAAGAAEAERGRASR